MKLALITLCALAPTVACSDAGPDPATTNESGVIHARAPGLPCPEIFEELSTWKDLDADQLAEREADVRRWIAKLREKNPRRADTPASANTLPLTQAYRILPYALFLFAECYDRDDWTARDIELATNVAQLAEYAAPGVAFDFESEERRDAELRRLADWYAEQLNDRRSLAMMVPAPHAGPWFPRDLEARADFELQASQPLRDDLVIELGHGPSETWCLRVRRGDEVRWISDLGTPISQSVRFEDAPVVQLGSYGTRVPMKFRRAAELYVSHPGRPLFYFTEN